MIDKKNIENQENFNFSDLEIIENKIIECLNEANDKLDLNDFSKLSESIISYIDDIERSKR